MRLKFVGSLELMTRGLEGHFKSAPYAINKDGRYLDVRQYRRFARRAYG